MSEEHISKSPKNLRIVAYGFDKLGFPVPSSSVAVGDSAEVGYLSFDANGSLADADGAIIPQGIFEEIEYKRSFNGTYCDVQVSKSLLQERQKQVFNLIEDGKWVCFLVGSIVDSVPQGDWASREIPDTDLTKRILNSLELTKSERRRVDGWSLFDTKFDEFRSYMRDWGVANTVFQVPYHRQQQFRVIAKSGADVVAVEWGERVFFLPFHTTKRDLVTLNLVSTEVARS